MNLYLLQQNINQNYDTYDSMIICAADPEEAINLSFGDGLKYNQYQHTHSDWVRYDCKDQIQVKLIGIAASQIQKGIVLSSFNAG